MTKKTSSPVDLASLELDLANSFVPSWAKETDTTERMSRLAEQDSGGDRRGGFEKRRDDRGPRPGGSSRGAGGGGQSRSSDRPQRSGPRPDRGGAPGRGGRDDRNRGHRSEREARPEVLTGWTLQLIPDRHGVEGMAKQIKTSAKTYPLFDLAKVVLEKPERYLVEFRKTSPESPALFHCKTDGSVWLSEAEAVSHVLTHHLETFYRRERVAVEPPKGIYPFVAVCGMSGVLLGPSNYHDYPAKVLKLHTERFSNVPFDVYKSRIKIVKDEESIQKWKEEQSSKDEFYPLDPAAPKIGAIVEEKSEAGTTAEITETVTAADVVEATLAGDTQDTPVPEEVAVLETETSDVSGSEAAVEVQKSPVPQTEIEGQAAEAPVKLANFAEVERHFRENHLKKNIVQIRERVLVPGAVAINTSSPKVVMLVRQTWEELRRFPLPLAHTLSRNLTSKGLQIFKAHQNITYVSVARPKYLDREATPVSDGLRGILEYLEANPSVPRDEQFKALVALRPEVPGGSEAQRESAVAADLFWLLREGHVIDFSRRGFEAARKPQVQGPGKKKTAKEGVAKVKAVPETTPNEAVTPEKKVETLVEEVQGSMPQTVKKADENPS